MYRKDTHRKKWLKFHYLNHISWITSIDLIKMYRISYLKDDIRSGFNVALLAFPQGMAYALIAGLPLQYGLYGSAISCILGPLFSKSKFITLGPTNATSVMILSAFATMGVGMNQKLEMIPSLVLMVGIFLVIGSYLKVANLIQFISRSVITGYITAAALLIICKQLKNALAIDLNEVTNTFAQTIFHLTQNIHTVELPTLFLSFVTVLIYWGLQKKFSSFPNVAITLLLSAGIAYFFFETTQLSYLETINVDNQLKLIPSFDWDILTKVYSPAFAIALLCVLEGISIGKSLAARSGSSIHSNQEMFSIGIANIGCGLLGGMPASGSLTRSALSCNSGAKTPLNSIISAVICILGIFLLKDYIGYIPKSSLAVLVIFIGISLINKHAIKIAVRATSSDAIVFYATLGVGLIFALDTAIYFGIVISVILFIRKAANPEMIEYSFKDNGELSQISPTMNRNEARVSIVHIGGNLFFGASDVFQDQIRLACEDPQLKVIVLKMRNAYNIDATSVMALEELVKFMNDRKLYLIISEAKEELIEVLKKSGIYESIGQDFIFKDDPQNSTLSTAQALRKAQKILGSEQVDINIYYKKNKISA